MNRSTSIPIQIAGQTQSLTNNNCCDDNHICNGINTSSSSSDHDESIGIGYATDGIGRSLGDLVIGDNKNNGGMISDNNNSDRHSMAQSLPHPNAPFLSSKSHDVNSRMSRIPPMALPGCAEDAYYSSTNINISPTDAEPTQMQPYGSLRNSRFHFTNSNYSHDVPYNDRSSGSCEDGNNVDNYSSRIHIARSVPTHKEINRDWVQQRWANQRHRDKKQANLSNLSSHGNVTTQQRQSENFSLNTPITTAINPLLVNTNEHILQCEQNQHNTPPSGLLSDNNPNEYEHHNFPSNSNSSSGSGGGGQAMISPSFQSQQEQQHQQLSTSLTAINILETIRRRSLSKSPNHITANNNVNNTLLSLQDSQGIQAMMKNQFVDGGYNYNDNAAAGSNSSTNDNTNTDAWELNSTGSRDGSYRSDDGGDPDIFDMD